MHLEYKYKFGKINLILFSHQSRPAYRKTSARSRRQTLPQKPL